MITVYNAQNYAQQWFFDNAYEVLKSKGKLNDQELRYERFLSLEGYFAHMKDLIEIKPSYVLIPSDEEPFVIDANTRNISIPSAFVKCAGVVGDNMCEIITFTIDRYFDYVDLATANICIQWEAHGRKGISHVSLIDLGTLDGKIRFGWPLTNELTSAPGPIHFAVRFFIKDRTTDKFVYLLNTTTTSITIKDGLNIVNPEVTEETIHDLFGTFVQNTINPTYPNPAPVVFDRAIGINLPERAKIEDDTLVLEAQATVADNGHIKYTWYFKQNATPEDREARFVPALVWDNEAKYYIYNISTEQYERAYPMSEEEFAKNAYFIKEELFGSVLVDEDPRFKIEEEYRLLTPRPDKRKGAKQYFELLESGAYKLITSAELPANINLYERIAKLTIVPSNETKLEGGDPTAITGMYWVGATNYVGQDRYSIDDENYPEDDRLYAINNSPEINSKYCYVARPEPIIITKDLNDNVFLNQDGENLKAVLDIDVKEDPGNPDRTFTWYRNPDAKLVNKNEDTFLDEIIQTGTSDSLEITDATKIGWYYANIESLLNRAPEKKVSAVCRVIEHTKAPTLLKMEYAPWIDETLIDPDVYFADDSNWTTIYDINDPDNFVEMGHGVAERGDIIRLRITTDLDDAKLNETGLLADQLDYIWHVISANAPEARALDVTDIDVTGNGLIPYESRYAQLGGREIDIRCLENNKEVSFFCKVENTLAGEKKALEQTDYKVVFKVW